MLRPHDLPRSSDLCLQADFPRDWTQLILIELSATFDLDLGLITRKQCWAVIAATQNLKRRLIQGGAPFHTHATVEYVAAVRTILLVN